MAFEIVEDDKERDETITIYGREIKIKSRFGALESKQFNIAYDEFAKLWAEGSNASFNGKLESAAKVADFFIPEKDDQEYIASLLKGTEPNGHILSHEQLMNLVTALSENMTGRLADDTGKAETGV